MFKKITRALRQLKARRKMAADLAAANKKAAGVKRRFDETPLGVEAIIGATLRPKEGEDGKKKK